VPRGAADAASSAVTGSTGPMSRPTGEPAALAVGARSMGGAAGALREVRGRLAGATSFEVVAGSWQGPASEAFLVDGAGLQTRLDRAAGTLDQAAGALSELAARLEHAQATWDQAQRLAAGAGVDLGSHSGAPSPAAGGDPDPPAGAVGPPLRSAWNPHGGVRSPADAVDPAAMLVAGQALRLAAAAGHEAAAARAGRRRPPRPGRRPDPARVAPSRRPRARRPAATRW
jgi:hypothetical protein